MDRSALADFVRGRREALRPADVGLSSEGFRRTPGLRRAEVATRAGISTDLYQRLEQGRAAQVSGAVIADIARALRLTSEEFHHIARLAGLPAPPEKSHFVEPSLLYLLDHLTAVPALVLDDILTIVAQNAVAEAVFGPQAGLPGWRSNFVWKWFAESVSHVIGEPEDRDLIGRMCVVELRAAAAWRTGDTADRLVSRLMQESPAFARIWSGAGSPARHESRRLTIGHPRLGTLEVHGEVMLSPSSGYRLVMFRPAPGSATAQQFEVLRQNVASP